MYVTITTSLRSYEEYWYWPIIIQKVFFWKQVFEQHKKIYQHEGKCDDQQNLKYILDTSMVLTPEVVTDNSPNLPTYLKNIKTMLFWMKVVLKENHV